MGLLSFLKRNAGDSGAAVSVAEPVDSVQQARTRARQRLIGAVVLVVLGVIGFSLLFESQPRPVPVDVPVEIARRDGTTVAPATPRRAAPPPAEAPRSDERVAVITEREGDAGRELPTAPAAAAPRSTSPAAPAPTPAPAPAAEARETRRAPEPRPAASAATPVRPSNDGARAQALLEGRNAPTAAVASGRYVVQVGAFAETAAAREARQKVERLGLKTYTQVVETSAGNRIRVRVGPFASREEADRAAGKLKSSGLPSSVLTL